MNALSQIAMAAPNGGDITLGHPDAKLLALSAKLPRMKAISSECRVKTDRIPQKEWDTEPFISLRKQREAAEKEVEATITEIFTTPAQSQAGYAAKADVYFSSADRLIGFSGSHGEFATSLNGMAHALLKDMRPQLISSQCGAPDAELIALCDRNVILEKSLEGAYPGDIPDDCPIMAEINRGLEQIWTMRATTLEGFRARARAIVEYAPDLLNVDEASDFAKRTVVAMLRDLIGEAR